MKIIKTSSEFLVWRDSLGDASVGFVPTMGALHEGHLSLVRRCDAECAVTVVSIFLNPLQFSENEDLDSYPVDVEGDIKKLESMGVDSVFLPSSEEIYQKGDAFIIDEDSLSKKLEGSSRPHFFKGVLTVVGKLFNIVSPNKSYFGKKDAQQLILIERMVSSLCFPIEIVACDTIREHNGLAMSSRNEYLSREQRDSAKIIFISLTSAKKMVDEGKFSADDIRQKIKQILSSVDGIEIDYVSVASLSDLSECKGVIDEDALISVAVVIGGVRLIDNIFCENN